LTDAVLLAIGDGAEVLDTLYPYYRLQEDGIECVTIGPKAREYQLVAHLKQAGWDITVESPGYRLRAKKAFEQVKPADYLGLILAGGRAPEYLRYDRALLGITRQMQDNNKPIGSICHGVEILAAADVIRGRLVATVAKCRLDVENAGGTYVNKDVVVDGNIISARDYDDCGPWMREFMAAVNKHRSDRSG
jgi:protease I